MRMLAGPRRASGNRCKWLHPPGGTTRFLQPNAGRLPYSGMLSDMTTTARLELRLPSQEKADLEEAARLSGRTVSEYVREATRDAVRTDLARSISVAPDTFDALLEALEAPSPALSPAMARAHARAAELGL